MWRDWFWDAVSNHNFTLFIRYLIQFSIVALLLCFINGYYQYLMSLIGLYWRTKLTQKALLTQHHMHEGGSQRVQEDCNKYPYGLITICVNSFRSILAVGIFIYLILSHLSWLFVLIPIIYTVISTGIAALIAKPLIAVNYNNQVVEARFRQDLTEAIYTEVCNNNLLLFVKTKYLAYFQSFYNQITVIVPYIILAPLYFAFLISFGILMQQAAAISGLIDALSYIINSFNDINKWLSCRRRLQELGVI